MAKTKKKTLKTSESKKNKSKKYFYLTNKHAITRKDSEKLSLFSVGHLPLSLSDDKKVVLKQLEIRPTSVQDISERLKNDIDVANLIIKKNPSLFHHLSENIKNNKTIAIKAVKHHAENYNILSERLKTDFDIIKNTDFLKITITLNFNFKEKMDRNKYLKILKIFKLKKYTIFKPDILIGVKDDVKNDKKIVLNTIELSIDSFESVPPHLKKDDDVIESFIKHKLFNETHLTKYFSTYNKNVAMLIVKYHPLYFKNLIKDYKEDKDVILSALKSNTKQSSSGYYIRDIIPYIPEKLLNDPDINNILESKKNTYYFSEKMADNKNFVLKNVHRWNTFKFVSNRLKKDKDVVMAALTNPKRTKYGSDEILLETNPHLREDKDVFLKALENRITIKHNNEMNDNKEKINECKSLKLNKRRTHKHVIRK